MIKMTYVTHVYKECDAIENCFKLTLLQNIQFVGDFNTHLFDYPLSHKL